MVIACQNNLDRLPKVDYTIGVPYSAFAFIRPLIINVAGQLLSYWIAKAKGLNADRPRNIAKSVTVL
jgi:glucosamine 6-phosphate synthetase-like amidotransferase/phosphosugar isomerase protein